MIDLSLGVPELNLARLLMGLALGAVLSTVLGYQYWKMGMSVGNRRSLALTIPLITITIVLIIAVVKSSVALSLGLVGALSIVRFRTPIKETEDLAYLFVAIGIGIALGADQFLPAVVGFVAFILVASARYLFQGTRYPSRNLYLNLDLQGAIADQKGLVSEAAIAMDPFVKSVNLRRVDASDNRFQATFFIECETDSALVSAVDALRVRFPEGSNVTFVDQDQAGAI